MATLHQALATDAAEIARLSTELGYPVSPHEIAGRLAILLSSPLHFVSVAREGSCLLGWIAAEQRLSLESGEKAELTGLVVDPSARRQGIGKLLVSAAERWAAGRGLRKVTVRSNIARKESHPFYESLGYARLKTAHAYMKTLPTPCIA